MKETFKSFPLLAFSPGFYYITFSSSMSSLIAGVTRIDLFCDQPWVQCHDSSVSGEGARAPLVCVPNASLCQRHPCVYIVQRSFPHKKWWAPANGQCWGGASGAAWHSPRSSLGRQTMKSIGKICNVSGRGDRPGRKAKQGNRMEARAGQVHNSPGKNLEHLFCFESVIMSPLWLTVCWVYHSKVNKHILWWLKYYFRKEMKSYTPKRGCWQGVDPGANVTMEIYVYHFIRCSKARLRVSSDTPVTLWTLGLFIAFSPCWWNKHLPHAVRKAIPVLHHTRFMVDLCCCFLGSQPRISSHVALWGYYNCFLSFSWIPSVVVGFLKEPLKQKFLRAQKGHQQVNVSKTCISGKSSPNITDGGGR